MPVAPIALAMTLLLGQAPAVTSLSCAAPTEAVVEEYVVVVSDIERTSLAIRQGFTWELAYSGEVSRDTMRFWGVEDSVHATEHLVGNRESQYGHVRLIQFKGVAQQRIRPGARWWDSGGVFNLNVLVRDLATTKATLEKFGWNARGPVSEYSRPGGVRGRSVLMVGPDDLVLSFQQRLAPPLQGWPPFEGATHVEVGYHIVTDLEEWHRFFADVLCFAPRDPLRWESSSPIGPNDFTLPHNSVGINDSILGGVYPTPGREQLIGARQFLNAEGFAFGHAANIPNIGIAVTRIRGLELGWLADRLAKAGISYSLSPAELALRPSNPARILAVEVPGSSGARLEFIGDSATGPAP